MQCSAAGSVNRCSTASLAHRIRRTRCASTLLLADNAPADHQCVGTCPRRPRRLLSAVDGDGSQAAGDDVNAGVTQQPGALPALLSTIDQVEDLNMLQTALAQALAAEDYSAAARVRDRIKQVRWVQGCTANDEHARRSCGCHCFVFGAHCR